MEIEREPSERAQSPPLNNDEMDEKEENT